MGDQTQLKENEHIFLNMNEYIDNKEMETWEDHMFSDKGFKIGGEDEVKLIAEHYKSRSSISDEDVSFLTLNKPPKPGFKVLTSAQYESKMNCSKKRYKKKAQQYYLDRDEYFKSDKGKAFVEKIREKQMHFGAEIKRDFAEPVNRVKGSVETLKPLPVDNEDSFDKVVQDNLKEGKERAQKLLKDKNGLATDSTMKASMASAEKFIKDNQRYIEEYKKELETELNKPENKQSPYDIQRIENRIKELERENEERAKRIEAIKKAMKGESVPTLNVSDKYFFENYEEPTEEPLYPEGVDLLEGVKQSSYACYFTSQLLALLNGNHDDFIKNVLVKEHPTDKKKAVVRLHDYYGLPVNIVVDKSRGGDTRPLWLILLEKAAAVLMNKSDFKKSMMLGDYREGARLKGKVDWEALERQQKEFEEGKAPLDFCQEGSISLTDIQLGSEATGAQMLFGRDVHVIKTREGGVKPEDEREEHLENSYIPGGDYALGEMAEFIKAGKLVIGGTSGREGEIEGIKPTYNYEKDRAPFKPNAPLIPNHAICFTDVDFEKRTVTLWDSEVDRNVKTSVKKVISFGEFHRYFSNVYVIDNPDTILSEEKKDKEEINKGA